MVVMAVILNSAMSTSFPLVELNLILITHTLHTTIKLAHAQLIRQILL
jgi:hypothetical protein